MSETETKENFLTKFINEKLIPFSTAFAQNKYVKSIGQGSMGLMAVIMIGAIFNLLNSIPITAYQNFLTVTGIGTFLSTVYNAFMNYMGLFMVFSVSYAAAKNFDHKDLAFGNALLAVMSYLILILLAQILWFFGIHGFYTVLGVLYPIWFTYIADNTAAAAAGQAVPHMWNVSMYDFACNGGAGCTFGLVIIMALFAKSKRYKAFGKMVLAPGIFNINEPVIYGMPLMMNFTFIIPFIVTSLLSEILAYVCIVTGLMPAPTGIIGFNAMPIFIYGVLQESWKIGVYQIAATIMSAAIWYPFFKAADNQALKEEQSAQTQEEKE